MKSWIGGLGAALAALALGMSSPVLAQPAQRVEVRVDAAHPGAVINRNVYGQFAEHLGRGIYEGIWVGEDSSIPNTRGYRNDVVAALRELHVPLVRWPGGCFADIYHWRDGIGPRDQRPVTLNSSWGGVEETNAFGTHEFFDFAELIGADAYINFNIASGTPAEMRDWIEYITSDSHSALANERRRNGREQPWKLPYVTIGNETWGCGGNMTAAHYADLYAQWATMLNIPGREHATRIASGGHGQLPSWVGTMMGHPTAPELMDAITLHQYTLPTGDWTHHGAALGFPEAEWMSTVRRALSMNEVIVEQTALMDAADPEKRIGLYVDEWGTWYDAEPGSSGLYQQNSVRDAVVAAATLNIFHAHADRVRMTNIAQMVNVLQAMILTDGPHMLRTPTYHVYAMYRPFQGATSLPTSVEGGTYALGQDEIPMVSASAARTSDGATVVALVNVDPRRAVQVNLPGVSGQRVSAQILTGPAMDSHNTFDRPDQVVATAFSGVTTSRAGASLTLPAKSVVVAVFR